MSRFPAFRPNGKDGQVYIGAAIPIFLEYLSSRRGFP